MAHQLANGDYRHNGVLIRSRRVPSSINRGFACVWRTFGTVEGIRKNDFYSLREACEAIDNALAAK